MADRGRGDHRKVPVVDQQAQELRLDPFHAAAVIAVQDLDFVTFLDAQVWLAPADRDAAVHRRQAHRVRAQRAKALDDALVLLAGVGHQEMIHGDRVGEAADLTPFGGDHPWWMAEPRGKLVQLLVSAMHQHERLLAGGDIAQ